MKKEKSKKEVSKFKVEKSGISGKGVFAVKDIKKGEYLCIMDGEEMTINEMIRRVDEEESEEGSDPLQIDNNKYIDLTEVPRSFNHSCDPNAFISGKNTLKAMKDIKKGEEITYDYSTTMNDNAEIINEGGDEDYVWTCKCNCGSKNCRGIINQFKTLPKKLKDYYLKNKLVPNHIQKSFE
ncbi:MAG TPA: SET domain-containing protein-lysine N-methyltransferase [Candidatus Paceibacterota bacterium]|nr:SET domain-containing protein-lysine N-methyltransferase [Candidatus Paceibacterota bacterium]